MSRPKTNWFKAGVCLAVVNNLKMRGIKPKRREYLESIDDVDKAYTIANRYIRNYIAFNDKQEEIEFWKEVDKLGRNYRKTGGKWFSNDETIVISNVDIESFDNAIVNETYEEFVSKIEEADRSIICNKNPKPVEVIDESKTSFDGISLIKVAIEKGVNKFSKKFLDLIGVEKEFVGFSDDAELYYCKSVNSIFVTI